jgi:hypothetical protein
MKRLFLITLLAAAILPTSRIAAQISTRTSALHVSLVPQLSTNGRHAARYTNGVSLNILIGVSGNERALTLGGLGNIVGGYARGFQGAGLFNTVAGGGSGVMAAGVINVTGGFYQGGQFAGLANIAAGGHGLQASGLLNLSSLIYGAQLSGLANAAAGMFGLQASGLVNMAGIMKGAQFAGLVNIAGDVNMGKIKTSGHATGVQFAGLFNVTGDIIGSQFAGLVNIADRVSGVQMAGLVNIARRSDYPIGLVNIIGNGEMAIGVSYNEIGTASVNFRSGGRVLYGIVGVGWNHRVPRGLDAFGTSGGVGAHIDIAPWMRINAELASESIWGRHGDNILKSGFSLLPAFRLGRVELFGGPGINHMVAGDDDLYVLFPKNSLWEKHRPGRSSEQQQVFIGWQAGVQFILK